MKILLATTRSDRSRFLIRGAAERKGLEPTMLYYEDMESPPGKDELSEYGFSILRDPFNTGKSYLGLLEATLEKLDPDRVLDYHIMRHYLAHEDKLCQHELFEGAMDMPRHWHFRGPDEPGSGLPFPLVAKKRISSRGRGVFVLNSEDELRGLMEGRKIEDFIFEERIGIERDIRLLFIGGRLHGAVERRIREKNNKGFTGIGVKVKGEFMPSPGLEESVREAASRSGSDFCGIDVAIDRKGMPWLMECNVSPQFIALERVLQRDAAGSLMDLIIEKHSRKAP